MNRWVIIYRWACIVLAVLFVAGLICIFLPKVRRHSELQKKKAKLQQNIIKQEELIMDLKSKYEQFSSDPEFVERVARNYGMVKPGETVFKFTNEPSKIKSHL